MLKRGFCQPPIAGIAQIKAMDALTDRAFNPGPSRVALLELRCFLAHPCRLQRVVLGFGAQFQGAWARGRMGTVRTIVTGAA